MPDIFLSYSREDNATATRFAAAFKRAGFSVWWDQVLRSGETYDEVTERALREAKAVVVLWSRHSVNSRWVRSEAKIADRNGTLIPVMIETCERPVMFELMQSADLTHWKGDARDRVWCAVVDDVRRLVSGEANTKSFPAATHRLRVRGFKAATLAILLVLLGAGAWWLLQPHRSPSIAVLPFLDSSAAGDSAPLADGLVDEISNWLAQIPELRVVARTSAFAFRGRDRDVRDIGKQLNATHVLEGTIRRGQNKVRIRVQLIETKGGFEIWSKTFDMPDGDVLHIEDMVSRSVAVSLNAQLTPDTERRWKARQVTNRGAQDLYLKGREEMYRLTREHNLRAMDLFRKAIEQDGNFTLGYVSLAEATLLTVTSEDRPVEEVAPQVVALLDRADALSPDLPDTLAVRGWLSLLQFRFDDATAQLTRSLALNPNDADTHRRLGNLYMSMAQPSHANTQFVLAAQLDPLHFTTQYRHCLNLQDLAEFASAEEACKRARALDPENLWGPLATAYLDIVRGHFADSLSWLERALKLSPETLQILDQRIWLLLEMGLYDEADRTLARLPESANPQRAFLRADIAIARQDRVKLASALEDLARSSDTFRMESWLKLARLQSISGDPVAAKASLDRGRQASDWQAAYQTMTDFFCLGESNAISIAFIELSAGNKTAAIAQLNALDATLDTFEQDGGGCAGLYSLRARSQALRGDNEAAMANLRKAHTKGRRDARTSLREPYLQSLRGRQDFQQLLAATDRELQSEAAAFLRQTR
jgi:TolB-like protein/Tfp pilus assembly protein PilF